MSNAEKRRKELVKEVYFIHQNTKPIKIENRWVQVATDYVVARGYMNGKSDEICASKDMSCELENHIPGVYWDTYEAGERELARLMANIVTNYSAKIKETFDILKEKYPEEML